jgi:hypothetical protein
MFLVRTRQIDQIANIIDLLQRHFEGTGKGAGTLIDWLQIRNQLDCMHIVDVNPRWQFS